MAKTVLKDEYGNSFKPEGAAKKLLLDDGAVKVVNFNLEAGQEVALHTSPHRVCVVVTEGRIDAYEGSDTDSVTLMSGDAIVYDAGEPHGFKAKEKSCILAFIFSVEAK